MILECRISDDVLDESDWGIRRLIFEGSRVKEVQVICQGVYDSFPQKGWTAAQVEAWSRYDGTGEHPEVFHEVRQVTVFIGAETVGKWTTFASIHKGEVEGEELSATEDFTVPDLENLDLGDEG